MPRSQDKKPLTRRTPGSSETLEIPDPFVGSSQLIRGLAEQAHKVAGCDSPVLLQGATGTGKGVLAYWLHAHSPRANEPFVDVNCAGLSCELLEPELFGHEKGVFTRKSVARTGLFEIADGGTIFLDEVVDIDSAVQPKLVGVLEKKRFRRLGNMRDRSVDIRFIAATQGDLHQLVQERKFRSDLYFRINTIRLILPPLSGRPEDIPALCECILASVARKAGLQRASLSPAALRLLQEYSWPGNVRELRNVLERALVLGFGPILRPEHLTFERDTSLLSADPGSLSLSDLEKLHIRRVLQEEHGRVPIAARRLGIGRSSLYKKIKDYGLALGS
jgi:DNA-binding NtrC family response regulator